jgi:hypothetical protein
MDDGMDDIGMIYILLFSASGGILDAYSDWVLKRELRNHSMGSIYAAAWLGGAFLMFVIDIIITPNVLQSR